MKKEVNKPAANRSGKDRPLPDKKGIKSSMSQLVKLGSGLRVAVAQTSSLDTAQKSKASGPTKKESIEINKMKRLVDKADRVNRARSSSKYKPIVRVYGGGSAKKCVFLSLVRQYNCEYSDLVKSIQVHSPWIPDIFSDQSCHSIEKAAFAIGWADLLGDESLVVKNHSSSAGSNYAPKSWKMSVFTGALKKLEKFRIQLTKKFPTSNKKVLLPMLQRAATRTYSHFKAVTAGGDSPYEELSKADLASMNGYSASFFKEIGRPCLALALFDIWFGTNNMVKLIDEVPQGVKFSLSSQRSLKQAAADCLEKEKKKFKKCPLYKDLSEWVFPSAF